MREAAGMHAAGSTKPGKKVRPYSRPAHGGRSSKTIYVATGAPELALRDIARLGLIGDGIELQVVYPIQGKPRLADNASLKNAKLIPYSISRAVWVWLQLFTFLGFSREARIICLSTPQNYRLLKLLAFTLRGRGCFSTGEGPCTEVSILSMLRLSWHNFWVRREQRNRSLPVLVIGSGSARNLRLLAGKIRARHPRQRLTLWVPALVGKGLSETYDDVELIQSGFGPYVRIVLRLLKERSHFGATIIPCTNDFNRWMKLPALLLPLREREIYNELGDVFELLHFRSGLGHLHWRYFQTRRKLAWPVAVIGSASGYYLEKIVASIRASFPGSEVHGWLGPLQASSAAHLFDEIHRVPNTGLSSTALKNLLLRGRRYRSVIIPCTDEPFRGLKFLSLLMPLPDRRIYNETGDGFPLREIFTAWRHLRWRLRHKFTFQFLSGSSDSRFLNRLLHVPAYGVRLASAAPLLLRGTGDQKKARLHQPVGEETVELLVSPGRDSQGALDAAYSTTLDSRALKTHDLDLQKNLFNQLLHIAETSSAKYIGILDGRTCFSCQGWLQQLLSAFDDTVAQVGPELHPPGRSEIYQGAFFDSGGSLFWNTNSAARFHGNPQWLEVGALPWVCLIIRREALLQIAPECSRLGISSEWIMDELCRRFALNGWLSICNTAVASSHPLKAPAEQFHLSTAS